MAQVLSSGGALIPHSGLDTGAHRTALESLVCEDRHITGAADVADNQSVETWI